MGGLLGRVEVREGAAVLADSGVPLAMIWRRLEGNESPAQVAEGLAISAADVLAALAFAGLGDPFGPPLMRAQPTRPALAGSLTDDALAALLRGSARPARLALAAGLLQGLDAWEASHEAAQEADDLGESATAAYWHGIAHRREPDPGNAAYWFRRVGRHPLFRTLGAAASEMIGQDDGPIPAEAAMLLKRGDWDPLAMIALCGSARPKSPSEAIARRLQRVEMVHLLDLSARIAFGD